MVGYHIKTISWWVHSFKAASARTKSSVLVLFYYAEAALNASQDMIPIPHNGLTNIGGSPHQEYSAPA